jgi:hypothetical protein
MKAYQHCVSTTMTGIGFLTKRLVDAGKVACSYFWFKRHKKHLHDHFHGIYHLKRTL